MTGIYLRVKRDGRFINIEVEHMTDGEREATFLNKPLKMLMFFNAVCAAYCDVEKNLKGER